MRAVRIDSIPGCFYARKDLVRPRQHPAIHRDTIFHLNIVKQAVPQALYEPLVLHLFSAPHGFQSCPIAFRCVLDFCLGYC